MPTAADMGTAMPVTTMIMAMGTGMGTGMGTVGLLGVRPTWQRRDGRTAAG